jgi:hypothetical protein
MNHKMLLKAWAFGGYFKQSCEKFIAGVEKFDFKIFADEVCLLSLGQLQHLMNTVGDGFDEFLVSLLLKWLDHGSNKQSCAALTMSVSFGNVRSDDREKYFSAILDDLEPELIKSCWKSIFHRNEAKLDPELTIFLNLVKPTLHQIGLFQGFSSVRSDGKFNKSLQNYIETSDVDTLHRKFVDATTQSNGRVKVTNSARRRGRGLLAHVAEGEDLNARI